MPNTTNVQKEAVVARQVAGKLLAQSNKEQNPKIKKQLQQMAGKNIAEANKIIKEEKLKQAEKRASKS
jgi:hypothetical protein